MFHPKNPINQQSVKLTSQQSTLDRQLVSIDEARPIAQQIDDRLYHLVHLAETMQWDATQEWRTLGRIAPVGASHLRQHHRRIDAVDANIAGAQLDRQRLGERIDGGLAGRIDAVIEDAHIGGHRRHVDDGAARSEQRHHDLGDVEQRLEVDVEDTLCV